jgi:hypothetical protein
VNLAETEALFTAGLASRGSAAQHTRTRRLICDNERIPPALALQIYGNNVSGALVKALTAAYPASQRILGEPCFNGIAHHYIEQTPSVQPDLNRYGKTFSDFLDDWTHSHAQFSDYRYLGDLARLEWLCHTAYYAGDDLPFDFRALAEASRNAPETLRFRISHSVGLLQSDYPVMAIRDANLTDGGAAVVHAGELPEHLVVSRSTVKPQVERIDVITFNLLAACHNGQTLGHIIDADRQRAIMITDKLPELIKRGWITRFAVDDASEVS